MCIFVGDEDRWRRSLLDNVPFTRRSYPLELLYWYDTLDIWHKIGKIFVEINKPKNAWIDSELIFWLKYCIISLVSGCFYATQKHWTKNYFNEQVVEWREFGIFQNCVNFVWIDLSQNEVDTVLNRISIISIIILRRSNKQWFLQRKTTNNLFEPKSH